MSPWTIKVATQNRVQHQEGRGHLPLRAEVQAYFQQEHSVAVGQILTLAVTFVIACDIWCSKTELIGEA